MRKPMITGFLALGVLIFGFGIWGAFTSISGAIVTNGQIEVEHNRQIVQHPDGGVVASIHVVEGARVAAGDVLIRLDATMIASELAIIEGRLAETLAHRARLEAERDGVKDVLFPQTALAKALGPAALENQMDGQKRLFEARLENAVKEGDQLRLRIDQIDDQVEGIDAQAGALDIQLSLIRQELGNQQGLLAKGLTQASTVLALQREEARLMGSVGELAASRAQALERVTETEVQIMRIDVLRRTEAADRLREIAPQEMELAERRLALLEHIARLEVRAPVSGVVMGLTVTTPRSVVRAAEPLLYLVPQDRPLVIAAQVPPIHIDQVHPGQAVELVFSAFSSRNTPHLKGKVMVVSADTFSDQNAGISYYRVELMPNEGELAKLNGQNLLPGMPVEAYIQTDARSPIAYLIKPFTDYFNRAFRES